MSRVYVPSLMNPDRFPAFSPIVPLFLGSGETQGRLMQRMAVVCRMKRGIFSSTPEGYLKQKSSFILALFAEETGFLLLPGGGVEGKSGE
eukprot:1358293-Amorphochlora_amoeboformis.AAC.1